MQGKDVTNWRSLFTILLITYEVQILLFVGDCYGINNDIAPSITKSKLELAPAPAKSSLQHILSPTPVPEESESQFGHVQCPTPVKSKTGAVPAPAPVPTKLQVRENVPTPAPVRSKSAPIPAPAPTHVPTRSQEIQHVPAPAHATSNSASTPSSTPTKKSKGQGRHVSTPAPAKSKSARTPAPPVRLNATSNEVVLDNGILQVSFAVPEGFVTGIRYGGLDNILNAKNHESQRGYWDIASLTPSVDRVEDDTNELRMIGAKFRIISQTKNQAEISFLCPASRAVPLQVDIRYVMLRGSSGFYSYAIFERQQGWPSLDVYQIRTVYKPDAQKFHYMAVSDKIQRIMPMQHDRESGQPLAYKEAVLLTNPTNSKLKGEVDDKYQYSCEDKDNKVHGWISFNPPIGVWIITPTDEFRLGGPHKQDLTAHVGPTLLAMFHSTHYAGIDLTMSFENGEPWKKVFGPYFVHLNSISGQGDPRTLWGRAKIQMLEEVKKWPYNFPLSKQFPKANARGSVVGSLIVHDSSIAPVPAASAWVGLATLGEVGSWQTEVKGYQFWSRTDLGGRFLIKNVRAGNYTLFAWVPGFIGDYKYSHNITITPGKQLKVDGLVYRPPRNGPTLWEIGVPDRTAAEFFIPDPRSTLANHLYLHDAQDKYRQYGLWDRYTDLYPKHDLVYTVNVSNFHKDWFYAHVLRRTQDTYLPTTWQIRFHLSHVSHNSTYTLQMALASATLAELQVRINNPELTPPTFTTLLIGRDNAIARHGIHGLYRLYSIPIISSLLKSGSNTIFLTQSRGGDFVRGVMYDYLRLEGPPSHTQSA